MIPALTLSARMLDAAAFGLRHARRGGVAIAGVGLLALGFVLLFLPGPGSLVLLAGLAVLGKEFAWARSLIRRVQQGMRGLRAVYVRVAPRRRERDVV
jgi:hypothetical protein